MTAARDLREQLADARRQREALLAQRQAVEWAPATIDEVRERVASAVNAMAEQWQPNLLPLIGADTRSDLTLLPEVVRDPIDAIDGRAWRGLVCSIAGPAVVEALVARAAEALRSRPEAIAAADRAAALADFDARLHACEILEERTVRQLEAEGHDVDRRPDCDPGVVLGALRDEAADRAA